MIINRALVGAVFGAVVLAGGDSARAQTNEAGTFRPDQIPLQSTAIPLEDPPQISGVLRADEHKIDFCYFLASVTPSDVSREFKGCQKDGGLVLDENKVAHQRIICTVQYDPKEFYKPKFTRTYAGEYQFRKVREQMQVRVPLTETSRVLETPDPACGLPRWQAMPSD